MSISWITPSSASPLRGPAGRGEVGLHGAVGEDEGGALRGDEELVLVGLQAVAGLHDGDGLVVGVRDHVLAEAVAERDRASLPPGEVVLAEVDLRAQVGGVFAAGERVEPHELAGAVEDHRARTARGRGTASRTGSRARSPAPGRLVHGDDRRVQLGERVEALHVRAACRVRRGNSVSGRRRRLGDREARSRSCDALRLARVQRRVNRDVLAGGERLARAGSSRRWPRSRSAACRCGGRCASRRRRSS